MMKAEYNDDMFIVINKKHLARLTERFNQNGGHGDDPDVLRLLAAISRLFKSYRYEFASDLNQKYYVCSQDEPYAQKVIDIILEGESEKLQIMEASCKE